MALCYKNNIYKINTKHFSVIETGIPIGIFQFKNEIRNLSKILRKSMKLNTFSLIRAKTKNKQETQLKFLPDMLIVERTMTSLRIFVVVDAIDFILLNEIAWLLQFNFTHSNKSKILRKFFSFYGTLT